MITVRSCLLVVKYVEVWELDVFALKAYLRHYFYYCAAFIDEKFICRERYNIVKPPWKKKLKFVYSCLISWSLYFPKSYSNLYNFKINVYLFQLFRLWIKCWKLQELKVLLTFQVEIEWNIMCLQFYW